MARSDHGDRSDRRRRLGRRVAVAALGVAALGGLVGCGSEPGARTDRGAAAADSADPTDPTDPKSYVGLAKTAATTRAKAAGVPWRITREDEEWFMVTQDYRENRMNFEIDDGVVTRATLG